MIFGCGSGRCGTRSLATQLGGLHEPEPWLKEEPVQWQCDGDTDVRESLIANLTARAKKDTPIIVDLKHSYVIDLICEVDPYAEFIWMLRNPVDCISSLLNGGAWTKTDWHGARKWRPKGGWNDKVCRERRVLTYWIQINNLIHRSLAESGMPWKLVLTESLTAHENVYSKRDRIDGELLEVVNFQCVPLYEKWSALATGLDCQ